MNTFGSGSVYSFLRYFVALSAAFKVGPLFFVFVVNRHLNSWSASSCNTWLSCKLCCVFTSHNAFITVFWGIKNLVAVFYFYIGSGILP